MKLTSDLFADFLKCPMKCYLHSTGQVGTGNAYADWLREQNDAYRNDAAQTLLAALPEGECAITATGAANLRTATWRLAVDLHVEMETMASPLHAIERVPPQGRGRPAEFIPVRFVFFNKLTKDNRLLVAFDALLLSDALGREVTVVKITHGDDHATLKVKVASLLGTVRKLTGKMSALLAGGSPPDLILNRHCGECEFRDGCRQRALEKDDLSLLGGMTEKERKKYHNKGIFTVTQLSYTFRPRRRPKRMRDKREKYHHSLKALAIREKKIHVVGSPELKIDGTPVYLDVEGLPDRDFYYLIGIRIGNGESAVQHSLWANTVEDEQKVWRKFLAILETVEKPVLIHYGSYETTFLKRMGERYAAPPQDSALARAIAKPLNLLSAIFAQIYYPTYSNGLKDIARFLGFQWSEREPSGMKALLWRYLWEANRAAELRDKNIVYNIEDCHALEIVLNGLFLLNNTAAIAASTQSGHAVSIENIKPSEKRFGNFSSQIAEFMQINETARWDYQRDRIYVRTSKLLKNRARRNRVRRLMRPNVVKRVPHRDRPICPLCGGEGSPRAYCSRVLRDLQFGRSCIKRWIVDYRFCNYWCPRCHRSFGTPEEFWSQGKYGRNLVAFLLYLSIDLCVPLMTAGEMLSRFFGFDVPQGTLFALKESAAKQYKATYDEILSRVTTGGLLHVDETQVSIRGKTGYVWVFTSLHEVAYVYADSREGALLQELLKDYKGILVSDFYGVYDSLACQQQKCLVHLIRDLNDAVLDHPYDEKLKEIVKSFAVLLKRIVETIDRRGLKRHFLGKHRSEVDRFYRKLAGLDCLTEAAEKCRRRFEKNRHKLFTFLSHDGVPWNNNNAEHAIKAFAKLRDVIRGTCTQDSARNYLVLLSVCQTCKYMGVDFLDFLRSGEKDIHAFAESPELLT
jgi:predicted RecB family nuclease